MMSLSVMFIVGLTLMGAVSAARLEPAGFASSATLEERALAMGQKGGAELAEAGKVVAAERPHAFVGFTTGLRDASPACSAAFDALNANAAYTQAINNVFDDAGAVGAQAAKECEAHLKPSYDPFGWWCKADATRYWTPDRRTDLPVLKKAADAVLGPAEVAPLVWLVGPVTSKASKLPAIYFPQKATNNQRNGTSTVHLTVVPSSPSEG